LPQQELFKISPGLAVELTSSALPGQTIGGTITAINPQVDSTTRNIRVQATVANVNEQLRPGMFVDVAVMLPEVQNVLTIPATAVLYAPYSDSVFLVEVSAGQGDAAKGQVVRQQFVRLGEKRGDFIAVRSGLAEGDTVVSMGLFKLRNGQSVVVDNSLAPEFKLAPQPQES
jgi:membrane fusion protein (multidrug efflux system)